MALPLKDLPKGASPGFGKPGYLGRSVENPALELAYTEYTANVTISATVEASATTIVTASSLDLDGQAILVEFYCPRLDVADTAAAAQVASAAASKEAAVSMAAMRYMSAPWRARLMVRPHSEPSMTPTTKDAISPPAVRASATCSLNPTASRVELPLMKETKKPPRYRKPSASTKPASAEKQAARPQTLRS